MSDVLTVEDIKLIQRCLDPTELGSFEYEALSRCIAKIEALQAQNKRLVEALEFAQDVMVKAPVNVLPQNHPFWLQMVDALSTLPAEALEAERRREEVIRAAKDWSNGFQEVSPGSHARPRHLALNLNKAVAALEALEGGK